jgi:hypothetical protein
MPSETLTFLLFMIVPFLLFIPFTIYMFRRKGILLKEWAEVGQRLGLGPYTESGSSGGMRGTLRGLPVRVYWEQRGGGKQPYVITVLKVELGADVPIGLAISNEGMFAKASKLAGAQDLQIGDDAFDKTFLVRAADEDEAREHLAPAHRREALLELRSLKGSSYGLADGVIFSELHGIVHGATLEAHLTQLVALARRYIHGHNNTEAS